MRKNKRTNRYFKLKINLKPKTMNDYMKTKAWDNFNYDLYLQYLDAKARKEETKHLEPVNTDKIFNSLKLS